MKMNSSQNIDSHKDDEEADDLLPGFRFHPTDEELVGFYLRRKVDKIPLSIELIKQIDIYKHDPWDLPKISSAADKEGYFFCKRGRKYRNSIRPNRVTGSGFWKATGIDKPVYSQGHQCIGLKKTLVYYRGSAGKGTKTDWMMNEFRLPNLNDINCRSSSSSSNSIVTDAKTTMPEAEVWTICRIFKRDVSYKKHTAEWREQSSAKRQSSLMELPSSTITYSMESNNQEEAYISFENPEYFHHHYSDKSKPAGTVNQIDQINHLSTVEQLSSTINANYPHESIAPSSSYPNAYGYDLHELLTNGNWDELRSVVDFAFDPST